MRTITVKGVGSVSAAPDYVVVSMTLETLARDYKQTMEMASKRIQDLSTALEAIGFEQDALKTTAFRVDTKYENVKRRDGDYHRVFKGFLCSHDLKVEFDFKMETLAKTLSAIAGCETQPEFSISFTIKDPSAVKEELLRAATINAKDKAEVLCDAAGVTLGNLLSIDYNWGEINIHSQTLYSVAEMTPAIYTAGMDIHPDEVEIGDTVTFVWEIT